MNIGKIIAGVLLSVLTVTCAVSCDKNKSYSELLNEEEHAVNWYLAQNEVETVIPVDSVFEEGPDAPFYRMTGDGSVYMRVIDSGDKTKRAKEGDRVYFKFMRADIKFMWEGHEAAWAGNAEDLGNGLGSTSFFYGNTVLSSSTQYGTGIQLPLNYLGYYSEVELVVKSLEGFTTDMSTCTPYIYKIKYFPAIY